jgi:hypothetical protein
VSHCYTPKMVRPKGDAPAREYVNARIRKDLHDALKRATALSNPTKSQAIEQAVELWLIQHKHLPAKKRGAK